MVQSWRIEVQPTEAEYTRALNRYWFRMYRAAVWAKPLLLILAIWLSFDGSGAIAITMAWTIFAFSTIQSLEMYLRYRRRNLGLFREYEDRRTMYEFSDDGVAASSELGSAQLRWRAFDRLWQYSDMWLLVVRKTQFYILPTRSLPDDLRQFIERRMQLGGGRRANCTKCGYDLRGQNVPRCPECGTAFDADVLKIRQ